MTKAIELKRYDQRMKRNQDILKQDPLEDYLLHRHENMLLDRVDDTGQLELTISPNDPQNRDFFTTYYGPSPSIASTIAMEILALGGIVSGGKPKPNDMVIFAGILNFTLYEPLPLGVPIIGTTQKVSSKGGFIKYSGELQSHSTRLATGSMLAFITTKSAVNDTVKRLDSLPETHGGHLVTKDASYKNPHLHMIDRYISDTETTCLTAYTFPETHPLTKGHFPGNPIMMGVLQWLTIEDACRHYAMTHFNTASVTITGNATLFKEDSSLVAEVKQFQVKVTHVNTTEALLTQTKRVSFRQMVRPKDTLFTYLTDLIIT
jgi:3-hydroxymyristoyl/3-hydroxydecanoyl-(acyl carrier protein) dehydratase